MKIEYSSRQAVNAVVMTGTGIVGSSLSQGAFNMLPQKAQSPWLRVGISALTLAGAFFVKGDDLTAAALRGTLLGTSLTQGRQAIVDLLPNKVTLSTNKFVQGMLSGPTNYIDAEDIYEDVEYEDIYEDVEYEEEVNVVDILQ